VVTLESIPLFQQLSQNELLALQKIVQKRHFAADQDVFSQGAPGDGVYFVITGMVEIASGSGERRIFSRLGPGEIFGEMAVIDQQPRSATATASQETEVFFLPRAEMLDFIERTPTLAIALLRQVSQRLREFNQRHLSEVLEAERLAVVGNFARSIIHDLKNPLCIIGLSVDLFSNPSITPESRTMAQSRINRQVLRINSLVEDILAFTEGRRTAQLKPGDFRAFVVELVKELEADISAKSVQLILENEPPAGLIAFDAHRLGRVFQNLVQNAADFLDGNGKILLRFKTEASELRVEIEDTGPGISPEIADKLFEPFATHGKSHGTGLGLSICKKIIADHGGEISVRSEAGHGAIFAFTLPLVK